jgi:hypothetical protein
MPYEFYYDKVTGNFRITIKNGYGLDPLRRFEQNYGRIRIAVVFLIYYIYIPFVGTQQTRLSSKRSSGLHNQSFGLFT